MIPQLGNGHIEFTLYFLERTTHIPPQALEVKV
jgi:hypothetical protein